ncbi:hypothetical protein [Portibacter lacus]|uniref:PEGA domain-containing protein n=1 Tax=Portibacter lacus TaxID=1099794 RepID=A0AA37SYQ8_9BACT|nr:hypothetical protein [Portibacter lacus]GLR19955.1 hypothetical protein GCM10007940_45710 [Portibacter lacus]
MSKYTKSALILLLFSFFIFSSCTKEPECLEGTVRFTNISSNPYLLYINGEFEMDMNSNSFVEIELPEGKHTAEVIQKSGYLIFPTVVEGDLNVFGCKESQMIFP